MNEYGNTVLVQQDSRNTASTCRVWWLVCVEELPCGPQLAMGLHRTGGHGTVPARPQNNASHLLNGGHCSCVHHLINGDFNQMCL